MFTTQHYFKLAEVLNYSLKVAESNEAVDSPNDRADAVIMTINHLELMLKTDNSIFNASLFEAFVYEDTDWDTPARMALRERRRKS